jgi:hypothetical protein
VTRNSEVEARRAEIVVADRRFGIRQAGDTRICQYSVTPVAFEPCMGGGTLSATISAGSGCEWTIRPTASWLTLLSRANGSGSTTLRIAFTDNYDAPRTGVVEVRWPTPTAGQNIHVRQAGCRYGVSQTQLTFAASGGTGTFDVLQQSDPTTCGGATQDRCVWSAVADADWIRVTSAMPRTGDDRVGFQVAANESTASRTGRIRVRDRVVTITQAGR